MSGARRLPHTLQPWTIPARTKSAGRTAPRLVKVGSSAQLWQNARHRGTGTDCCLDSLALRLTWVRQGLRLTDRTWPPISKSRAGLGCCTDHGRLGQRDLFSNGSLHGCGEAGCDRMLPEKEHRGAGIEQHCVFDFWARQLSCRQYLRVRWRLVTHWNCASHSAGAAYNRGCGSKSVVDSRQLACVRACACLSVCEWVPSVG